MESEEDQYLPSLVDLWYLLPNILPRRFVCTPRFDLIIMEPNKEKAHTKHEIAHTTRVENFNRDSGMARSMKDLRNFPKPFVPLSVVAPTSEAPTIIHGLTAVRAREPWSQSFQEIYDCRSLCTNRYRRPSFGCDVEQRLQEVTNPRYSRSQ